MSLQLVLAGPILGFWWKYVFCNIWHCTTIFQLKNYLNNEFIDGAKFVFITRNIFSFNWKKWNPLIRIIHHLSQYERYLLISHMFKFVDMYILTPWFLLAHSYVCGLEIFSLASFVCLWFVAKGHYQRIANVDLFVINMPSSWRENAAIRLRIIYIIKQSLRSIFVRWLK